MKKYKFRAEATVSCWTEVEANSAEEAKEIAESRDLAGLCHMPYTGEVDEEWHFDNDGSPLNIQLDQD